MGGYPENTDDVIDSCDVIEAIAEIEAEIQDLIMQVLNPDGDVSWGDVSDANIDAADGINVLPQELWPDGLDDVAYELWDLANVLVPLRKLASQGENYAADWQYGEALINDDHFEDYAKDLATDIGAYDPNKLSWPLTCIDWEAAADALREDYTAVDFDGVTYWVR